MSERLISTWPGRHHPLTNAFSCRAAGKHLEGETLWGFLLARTSGRATNIFYTACKQCNSPMPNLLHKYKSQSGKTIKFLRLLNGTNNNNLATMDQFESNKSVLCTASALHVCHGQCGVKKAKCNPCKCVTQQTLKLLPKKISKEIPWWCLI